MSASILLVLLCNVNNAALNSYSFASEILYSNTMDTAWDSNTGWIANGTISFLESGACVEAGGVNVVPNQCWSVCQNDNMYLFISTIGYQNLELRINLEPKAMYATNENCQIQVNIKGTNNDIDWIPISNVYGDGKAIDSTFILSKYTWNINNLGIRIYPNTDTADSCCYASVVELRANIRTPDPTYNPTQTPTISPSDNPTQNPSMSPIETPTKSPTKNPTYNPSYNPSMTPSKSPSKSPSTNPTYNPSYNPSMIPTKSPTNLPTYMPTMSPSNMPSMMPTNIVTEIVFLCPDESDAFGNMLTGATGGVFAFLFIIGCCSNCAGILGVYFVCILRKRRNEKQDARMDNVQLVRIVSQSPHSPSNTAINVGEKQSSHVGGVSMELMNSVPNPNQQMLYNNNHVNGIINNEYGINNEMMRNVNEIPHIEPVMVQNANLSMDNDEILNEEIFDKRLGGEQKGNESDEDMYDKPPGRINSDVNAFPVHDKNEHLEKKRFTTQGNTPLRR